MDSRGTIPCLPRVSDAYDGVENVAVAVAVGVAVAVAVAVAVVVGVVVVVILLSEEGNHETTVGNCAGRCQWI